MAIKNEKEFDDYLKQQAQMFILDKYQIEPSCDFCDKTMTKIVAISHRRKFISDIALPLIIFAPFAIQQGWRWFFMNHDYFAITQLPFSDFVLTTYLFFVSNVAAYLLIGIGAIIVSGYFIGTSRLSYAFKTISTSITGHRFKT